MQDREQTVADILVNCVLGMAPPASALIVGDDTGRIGPALEANGIQTVEWRRQALGGEAASAWPSDGPFDLAAIRLPRGREALEMVLHATGSRLGVGGRLLVCGASDEGIKSAAKQVGALFGEVETVDVRRRCRVLQAVIPEEAPALRAELANWRLVVTATSPDGAERRWVSYPGVFAHGRLDEGTQLLLDTLPAPSPGQRALDYGCGAGIIAAELLRRQPQARVDLLDNDALAIEAARQNVPQGRAISGDGWRAVGQERYDLIVSNPPLHRGKAMEVGLLGDFVGGLEQHLARGGEAVFVVQRTAPTAKLLAAAGLTPEVEAENNRFRVWRVWRER